MMCKCEYDQDEYIADCEREYERMTNKTFKSLRDIPYTMLMMVLHIRGWTGNIMPVYHDKPQAVRLKNGNITLKY